jgi:ACS family D-galactonate transporter-like MFS transporter
MTQTRPLRGLLLFLLTLGMFFCYAQRGTLAPAAPFMMKELHLNAASMGFLLSAFSWTYLAAQIPAGWLVDRWGFARVYAAGFTVWAVATALTGLSETTIAILLARLLTGLGQGAIFPASNRAVATWFKASQRGAVTGVYIAGNRLGQAAIVAVGPLAIAAFGWRYFFFAAGAAGLIWLVPWLLLTPRWEPEPPSVETRKGSAGSIRLLANRNMAGIFFGFFAYDYAWFLYTTWMPGYLMIERKFGPREMAIYSAVPLVIVSVVILLAGMAGDYLVRKGMDEVMARKGLICAGLLIACLIVPAALVTDNFTSAVLLGISLAGLGLAAPNAWALTQAVVPKEFVATASGMQNLGGNIGGALAPAVTGIIVQQTGSFVAGFVLTGVILVAGIVCYWVLIKPAPVASASPTPVHA